MHIGEDKVENDDSDYNDKDDDTTTTNNDDDNFFMNIFSHLTTSELMEIIVEVIFQ